MLPPVHIVSRWFVPAGLRLKKKVKPPEPPPIYQGGNYSSGESCLTIIRREAERRLASKSQEARWIAKHKFLCLNDIRFWTFIPEIWDLAACRACGQTVGNRGDLMSHQNLFECPQK